MPKWVNQNGTFTFCFHSTGNCKLVVAQVEILTGDPDLQSGATPGGGAARRVFVLLHGAVVQLWKCHHCGDQFLFHLHRCSVDRSSGMLRGKHGSPFRWSAIGVFRFDPLRWVLSRRERQFSEILVSRFKNILIMVFLRCENVVGNVWLCLGSNITSLGLGKDDGFGLKTITWKTWFPKSRGICAWFFQTGVPF